MPRDAASTRDALIAAGLDLFAEQGVYTTPLSRIVGAAGQRNTSALHYHFAVNGLDARHGLLFAIIDAQNEAIEAERRDMLDNVEAAAATTDLRRLVWAYVQPQANRLGSIEGRRFLSIVSQLVDLFDRWDEDPERTPAQAMRTFRLIERALPSALPPHLRRERVARFVEMVSESLGARARRLEKSRNARTEHEAYVSNLIDMAVGALSAPMSAG
ncbi:MAG: TetR/AcrR family transcriptional regulator [Actinomycetota bacterium]